MKRNVHKHTITCRVCLQRISQAWRHTSLIPARRLKHKAQKFKVSLGYVKVCLKQNKAKQTNKTNGNIFVLSLEKETEKKRMTHAKILETFSLGGQHIIFICMARPALRKCSIIFSYYFHSEKVYSKYQNKGDTEGSKILNILSN